MSRWKTSPTILNRKGDKRSPCLNPFWKENSSVGEPFTNTEALIVEKRLIIYNIHFHWKPMTSNTSNKNSQSTESKAFSKSNLRTIPSISFFLMEWTISFVIKIHSDIYLPSMNPDWLGVMILSITTACLLVSNFDSTFREQFIRLIGLKSLTCEGISTLGIKVIKTGVHTS